MRVALFTETFLPKVDGIVTVVCLLLDHLTRRGIETTVVAPRMGVRAYRDTPVIGVPGVVMPLYPELRIGPPTPWTYRALKRFRPDVVHIIHPALIGIPGLWMARRLGVPTVASFHLDVSRLLHHFGLGPIQPITDWITREAFNTADVALAPSRRIQADMRALGVREVGLWRRGVDAESYHPRHRSEAMRRAMSGGCPDDLLLVYVGRLSNEKRLGQLRAVLERVPGTRLALVGDGPARERLGAEFAGLPVTFMGYLTGDPLYQAYASGDVFVFPSALETFGLVVVEALAAGLPVVASRVGGVADVVREGETGYTFEPGDVDGLVSGVRALAADPARRLAMGRAARAFAETLGWDAMMDEVVALYEELVTSRATRDS